jgi:hypothetical protein
MPGQILIRFITKFSIFLQTDAVVAPLFTEAPDNCQFVSAWESLLPGREYWGTYGAFVSTSLGSAPATPVTIDATIVETDIQQG